MILGFSVDLAPLREADREDIFRWRNDPKVMRWTRQNDLLTWERHAVWFNSHQLDPSIKMYGIHTQFGLSGVCGLTSIDLTSRRAEFSLYIAPNHHRKGFGKSALATLLSHAFLNLGLNCVWGETFEGNPAAKMFEDMGFKKEGTRREFYFREGLHMDAHLYSMLAREWLSGRPTGTYLVPSGSDIQGTLGTLGTAHLPEAY